MHRTNGDWGLGIGDWGLGPIPNPQSPIPFCFKNVKNNFLIDLILDLLILNYVNIIIKYG
jgi:hypothetical protein